MLAVRRIVGGSMLPTLSPGTIVLGLGWLRPRVGDIVIARSNDREIIKRVVKADQRGYYLVGDNASQSTDSRHYGWLAKSQIKSVIIGRIKR